MTAELLAAHRAGRVEVAIGRASDYFGPGHHPLGARAKRSSARPCRADRAGDGRPRPAAQLLLHTRRRGRADHPRHAARGRPDRSGTSRSREARTHPADHRAGLRPRRASAAAARRRTTTLRLLGIVKPAMREYLHTLYQFTDRWVVDDSAFRAAFGVPATPLPEALATTVDWYRSRAAVTVP